MIGERTRRLLGLFALATAVLALRLAWIQVAEHEIWAGEAARLLHSGRVIPYSRGAILAADGEVLARDVEAYDLVFAYRPFRRDHPLGQVAHARSALAMRAVTLAEARHNLERWALELVGLAPAALDDFARGGALATASLDVPAASDPGADGRRERAADLRFYARGLLDARTAEWRAMEELARERAGASYLELLAELRDVEPADLAAQLRAQWTASIEHLAFLAERIDLHREAAAAAASAAPAAASAEQEALLEEAPAPDPTAVTAVDRLIEALEESRRAVEGAAASALFEEASGFPPGRVDPHTLLATFDLEGLRVLLRWDATDLEDWARRARARWIHSWRDGYALPRLLAELTLDPALPPDGSRVLSALAALFVSEDAVEAALDGNARDWRELEGTAVLSSLDGLFLAEVSPRVADEARRVFPWQDPTLRASAFPPELPWEALARVLAASGAGDVEPWRAALEGRTAAHRDERFRLARELCERWEAALQAAIKKALEETLAAAGPDELGPAGGLAFEHGRFDRAEERSAYILRDFGARQRSLVSEPGYDVVYLLTRYPERYPGFDALETRRRERTVAPGDERALAEFLIGSVSRADVRAIQRQRAEEQRLFELRQKAERTPEEEDELVALVEAVLLPDEESGVSGIEAYFDRELRGRNGYREQRGLEDVGGGGAEVSVREAVDGSDVTLTLVSDLQRAAERVINHPRVPREDARYDPLWYDRPAGAIVLITPDGDVLAAASAPLEGEDPPAVERTLGRPTFQPPGSVFKPFVALWALDRAGLDPSVTVDCALMADGHAGYGDVRCSRQYGHGPVDLGKALEVSCNAYFAWLGERLATQDFHGLAHAFGFGEPTGVRSPPLVAGAEDGERASDLGAPRRGLAESVSAYVFDEELSDALRRRAGNGLGRIEATPLQVARATAGLATGALPSLRLVAAVGGAPVARVPAVPLPFSSEAQRRVRDALVRVTHASEGSAHVALSPDALGFEMAAKTGSADLVSRKTLDGETRVRKHAWVAGWAPIEKPVLVVVVFVHDTTATSSHGAVYVAQEILTDPAVRAWLAERGMALEESG